MDKISEDSSSSRYTVYKRNQDSYKQIAEIFARGPETEELRIKLAETINVLVSTKCKYEKGSYWSLNDDCNDPMVLELENLLRQDIKLIVQGAIKKVVKLGYTEERAQKAILNVLTAVGMEGMEFNLVNGAIYFIKCFEKRNDAKDSPPVDLEGFVSLSVLGNVGVLRETMPGISIAEAIWNLLICDSNLMLLCAAKAVFDNNYPGIKYHDIILEERPIKETGETSNDSQIQVKDILKPKTKVLREDKKGSMLKTKVVIHEENVVELEDSPKNLEDRDVVIPCEESSPDERDIILAILQEKVKELEKEKEDWMKWANQKVMQVAKRLGRDQKELKKLRADKEEAEKSLTDEKVNKNKSSLLQLLSIWGYTRSIVEKINTETKILEEENSELKKSVHYKMIEVETASEEIKKSELKEQHLLKRLQEEEKMNNLLTQELKKLKARRELIESNLNKDKALLKQQKGTETQITKEIEQIMKSAESMRLEREQMINEANEQQEEELKKSEKYKEEIEQLEAQKRVPVSEDMYECAMCLDAERSVVFLPCSHQVVCVKCSDLLEEKGVKECPACRTTIDERIPTVLIDLYKYFANKLTENWTGKK